MPLTYDIHFTVADNQLSPNGAPTGKKPFTFGFKNAVAVRGPQKLVNRWLKCFLTTPGSDFTNPRYGTGFPLLIGANVQDEAQLTEAVTLFIDDCNQQMQALDRVNLPPADERFQAARLRSVVKASADGYYFYVEIKNAAGQALIATIPAVSRG